MKRHEIVKKTFANGDERYYVYGHYWCQRGYRWLWVAKLVRNWFDKELAAETVVKEETIE